MPSTLISAFSGNWRRQLHLSCRLGSQCSANQEEEQEKAHFSLSMTTAEHVKQTHCSLMPSSCPHFSLSMATPGHVEQTHRSPVPSSLTSAYPWHAPQTFLWKLWSRPCASGCRALWPLASSSTADCSTCCPCMWGRKLVKWTRSLWIIHWSKEDYVRH